MSHTCSTSPRLFVVVPFFESPAGLRRCISSLRHQTIPFQAVLIDDSSSPATHRRAQQLVEGDRRLTLLRRAQCNGPAAARKSGLDWVEDMSTSAQDIVVLVDGDDRLVRDTALELIRDAYATHPHLQITLGRSITRGGHRSHKKTYRRWYFRANLVRHLINWRADAPRSFRVGLYRACRDEMRFKRLDGRWLQGGTDVALMMPMLQRCGPKEVTHLDHTLYEYQRQRPDGQTMDATRGGRARQYLGEYIARRSLPFTLWKTLRYPRRSVAILHLLWSEYLDAGRG